MRRLAPSLLLALAFCLTGCSRFFIQKDAYATVKRAALVQYAINPHMLMGTANADEARWNTAAGAYQVLAKELGASWQLMPLAEMLANPGYAASGGHPMSGFETAKGALFFSRDARDLQSATLDPQTAQALCAALNVDAVIAIHDSWGQQQYAMGFRAQSSNLYTVAMYDKTGAKVWSDMVGGNSEEGMSLTFGVISTDVPTYVLNNLQAFTAAVRSLKAHLSSN